MAVSSFSGIGGSMSSMAGGTSVFTWSFCNLYHLRYFFCWCSSTFLPTLKKALISSCLVILHFLLEGSGCSAAFGVVVGDLGVFYFLLDFGCLTIVILFFDFQSLEGFLVGGGFDLLRVRVASLVVKAVGASSMAGVC